MNVEMIIPRRRLLSLRFIRRLHLWIGAWGAIAAILFGFTGFLQNHRALLKLPQGDSTDVAKIELPVPEPVRQSPEQLRAWLHDAQHLKIDNQRIVPRQPAHWMFMGGNARTSLLADYALGADSLTLRTSVQSPLAVMGRLHKGVGGGIAWILLTDSFALAMIALGVSGLILWSRGRTTRQMVFSIVGAAVIVILLIGGSAVI